MTTISINGERCEIVGNAPTGLQLRAAPFIPIGGEDSFYHFAPDGTGTLVSNDDVFPIAKGDHFYSVSRLYEADRLVTLLDALEVVIEPDPDEPGGHVLRSRHGYVWRRTETDGDWCIIDGPRKGGDDAP